MMRKALAVLLLVGLLALPNMVGCSSGPEFPNGISGTVFAGSKLSAPARQAPCTRESGDTGTDDEDSRISDHPCSLIHLSGRCRAEGRRGFSVNPRWAHSRRRRSR